MTCCYWERADNPDVPDRAWITTCRNSSGEVGNPEGWEYCPYCGRKVFCQWVSDKIKPPEDA